MRKPIRCPTFREASREFQNLSAECSAPYYLGCPYWIYEPASGQWYHTLDQDAPDDIGPFPSEEEAIGKAILRIGAVVTEERRKLGLL